MPRIESTSRTELPPGTIPYHKPDTSMRSEPIFDTPSMTTVTSASSGLSGSLPSSSSNPANAKEIIQSASKFAPKSELASCNVSTITRNALRPDNGGSAGRPTSVSANFFPLRTLPSSKIFHYDVAITPEIPPQKAKLIWTALSKEGDFASDHARTVFDGRSNAFAVSELTSVGEARTLKIDLMDGSRSKVGANIFTVKIAFVAVIDVSELQLFLDRKGPFTPNCATAIQALNIAVTHKSFPTMVNVGRSVYTPNNSVDLGGGIEKWDGIFQSVRPGQRDCFINIDTTATTFVKGGNAETIFSQVLNSSNLNRQLDPYDISKVERVLKGCVFTVDRGSVQKRFKVTRLSEKGADRTMFDLTNNDGRTSTISVEEYFIRQYDRRLRYPSLPCIGAKGSKTTIYFPAEVCFIKPGQHYKKKLNEEQVAQMIRSTAIKPYERSKKIRDSLRLLDFEGNQYLKAFGIRISSEMAVIPARILQAPAIEFSGGQERPNMGAWQAGRGHRKGARLESWAVLCFERENRAPMSMIMNFMRRLSGIMSNAGISVNSPQPSILYAQTHGDIGREIESIKNLAERQSNRPLQLLMVLFPNKSAFYPVVKTYCETRQIGLMTQCALLRKISKPDDQYCRMITLKINTKLGGIVGTLASNSMPFMDRKSTLIIGADVSHPAPGEDSKPSIASVVASIDDMAARFIGRLIVQDPCMEVIHDLQPLVKELVKTYKRLTGHHPKRILFYRDGVSEGQFETILKTEVNAIKRACMELDNEYTPPLTFVVVKKRHHARFFPQRNDQDRSGNCVPGTVVDTVITHPTEFVFYLQSHAGIQGTSRSTLYHVLLDENKFTSDSLQQLTFNLCHIYCRCTRSLSIVPVVQYAHLLAFRGRYYLDSNVMPVSSDRDPQKAKFSSRFGEIKIAESLMNQMFFV
ncbi:hypothetical protein BGX27_007060 [Mortierella sp. AM989]|nr:hypothetical protein BGX27_007060 [Mortierella sp. AM989]